jgi:hypothetical protein
MRLLLQQFNSKECQIYTFLLTKCNNVFSTIEILKLIKNSFKEMYLK